jgi:hypothetical protein
MVHILPEDFPTYGAYLRSKNLKVGYCKSHLGQDYTRQKKWDRELAEYRQARSEGIQPKSTRTKDIRDAMKVSDKVGKAFDATKPLGGVI